MNAPNYLAEEEGRWVVSNTKGETLTITFGDIHFDTEITMGDDPGLRKDGVEADLQRLLAEQPGSLGEGMELVKREYQTPIGPVDLLCRDTAGVTVAVEVKRRGKIDGVEQLSRYLEFLNRDDRLAPVRGLFVAQLIKPQARLLAEDAVPSLMSCLGRQFLRRSGHQPANQLSGDPTDSQSRTTRFTISPGETTSIWFDVPIVSPAHNA